MNWIWRGSRDYNTAGFHSGWLHLLCSTLLVPRPIAPEFVHSLPPHNFRDFVPGRSYIQHMSIWILAIALLAIFGALGFVQGSIRMMISFLGVIFGVF